MGEKFDSIKNIAHKKFIIEYLANCNATEAYRKVYPKSRPGSAAQNGSRLLRNDKVSAALNEKFREIWDKREADIGRVYADVKHLALSDIKDIADLKNEVLTLKDFDKIDTRAIQQVKIVTETKPSKLGEDIVTTRKEIKLYDKTKVLSDILKVLKMIDPDELTGTITIIPAVRPDRKERQEA